MKTKNLIIGVLTVAVVTLSVMLYRAHTDTKECKHVESKLSNNAFTQDELNMLCMSRLDVNDGGLISWNKAKEIIDTFQKKNPNEQVRAFHVGLSKIDSLMTKIRRYNAVQSNPKIVGLRFYRGVTTRTFSSSVFQDKPDLIILPSLADTNLHEINPSADVPIYTYFRPCPKLCKRR